MITKSSKLQVSPGWNLLSTVLTLGDVDSSTEEHRVLGSAATFLGPILSKETIVPLNFLASFSIPSLFPL